MGRGYVVWEWRQDVAFAVDKLERDLHRPRRLGVEVRVQAFQGRALLVRDELADADFNRERVRQREVIQRGVLLPRELPGARQLGERQAVHRIYRVQSLGQQPHLGRVLDHERAARAL